MNRKMKVKTILTLALAATTLAACHRGKKPPRMDNSKLAISLSKPAKGDRAIYGLACLGCSDTALVLLPNGGGDPVRYNILDATRNHQVFGDIEVGDWVCVMPCEEKDEKNRADMVIDLDQLKATWTYPVMPKLRDVSHLSKRQQARILANMPDSIVETYMVPRQYGFTLKRMSEAMAVGRVMINKDVDDDSPVEYPDVPQYTEWHAYNGKLILVQGRRELEGVVINGCHAAPHILNIGIPGVPTQNSINLLQDAGICVSAGSACAKGHRSHVLTAMKIAPEIIDGSFRVSLCRDTTEEEIRLLVKVIREDILPRAR